MADDKFSISLNTASSLQSVQLTLFRFVGEGGRTVLTIYADGRIDIGEGVDPGEAGRQAVEAMRHHLQFLIAAEREACAKIAESEDSRALVYADGMPLDDLSMRAVQAEIASAIRARNKKEG